MSATMEDVAKLAGVTQPAVSAALGSKPSSVRVSARTRQRILRAAEKLKYQPIAAARALARRRAGVIGFLLSDATTGGWANAYFAWQLTAVEHNCQRRGYAVQPCLYNLTNIKQFVLPKQVGERAVDGVITTGSVRAEIVEQFVESGIPMVHIGEYVDDRGKVPVVSYDVAALVSEAVRHAVSLGHRRIGLFTGPSERSDAQRQQVESQLAADGEPPVTLLFPPLPTPLDHTAGSAVVQWWMGQVETSRPTLLIASDQVLAGVVKELARRGLQCPRDLSLISQGDSLLCELLTPGLTAIDQDVPEMARVACDLLVDRLEAGRGRPFTNRHVVSSGGLVERESVGPTGVIS